MSSDETTRIAIINLDRCKGDKCKQECKKSCPVVKIGKQCVEVERKAYISEEMCIGCGICVKRCPFGAISIINVPKNLEADCIFRYGRNGFKLHRLPIPRLGEVLGLVGTNGIGKTTALKLLSGKLKPNFGKFDTVFSSEEIIDYFKGSELQQYFTKKLKVSMKVQYVNVMADVVKGVVRGIIKKFDERHISEKLIKELELEKLMDRQFDQLSGGELQRMAVCLTCMKDADVYIFDEPSSYLDIKQRLSVSNVIRWVATEQKYVIVVEHDLSVLDYMSDYICCLYGQAGAYGVITMPFNVREGINIFLDGYVPTENMRFRKTDLSFKVAENVEEKIIDKHATYSYPAMNKTQGQFKLHVERGTFTEFEITVMLGRTELVKPHSSECLLDLVRQMIIKYYPS